MTNPLQLFPRKQLLPVSTSASLTSEANKPDPLSSKVLGARMGHMTRPHYGRSGFLPRTWNLAQKREV